MKKIVFTIILMFAVGSAFASSPKRTLTIFDINGKSVEIPIKTETAPDSVPIVQRESMSSIYFDLSRMTKPEPDADDITIDTREIFLEIVAGGMCTK